MSQEGSVSPQSDNDKGSSLDKWKRISKRVGFQKNWTKECIIKVLNDSNGDALQGKDLQKIPFNANRKKVYFIP